MGRNMNTRQFIEMLTDKSSYLFNPYANNIIECVSEAHFIHTENPKSIYKPDLFYADDKHIVICEIKSCTSDLRSGFGLNFIFENGVDNYLFINHSDYISTIRFLYDKFDYKYREINIVCYDCDFNFFSPNIANYQRYFPINTKFLTDRTLEEMCSLKNVSQLHPKKSKYQGLLFENGKIIEGIKWQN